MKKVYKNVKHSNPISLFALLITSIILIFIATRIINHYVIKGVNSFIISIVLSILYFFIGLKYIIKKTDFRVYSDRVEYNDKKIYFNNVKSYKIHWIKGVHLKMKLKNGKVIRISSNSNFYNAKPFVSFCKNLNHKLEKTDGVVKQKPFFESKYGYYLTITLTLLVIGIIVYELFTGFNIKKIKLALMLVGLSGIWSQVNYKRNK